MAGRGQDAVPTRRACSSPSLRWVCHRVPARRHTGAPRRPCSHPQAGLLLGEFSSPACISRAGRERGFHDTRGNTSHCRGRSCLLWEVSSTETAPVLLQLPVSCLRAPEIAFTQPTSGSSWEDTAALTVFITFVASDEASFSLPRAAAASPLQRMV